MPLSVIIGLLRLAFLARSLLLGGSNTEYGSAFRRVRQMLAKAVCPWAREQAREQPRYRWQSVDGEHYEPAYPVSQLACRPLEQFAQTGLLAGSVPTTRDVVFAKRWRVR